MNQKKLQEILDKQPSSTGSTYFIFTLWGVCWLLTAFFLVLSIGLLMESLFHYRIFMDWVIKNTDLHIQLTDEQRWNFSTSFGFICLILCAIFLATTFLCRMILKRNHFILEIEDWLEQNIENIVAKPRRKKKA